MKKLSHQEEAEIMEQVQKLAQQDDSIELPPSLHSSALLEKLQEQPSLVAMEGGAFPKHRTVYVIGTCAAAFLMVFGLSKMLPAMSGAGNMAEVESAYSTSAATQESADSEYGQIVKALRLLADEQEDEAAPYVVRAEQKTSESPDSAHGAEVPEATDGTPEAETEESVDASPEESEMQLLSSQAAPSSNDLVSSSGEWVYWLEQDDETTLHLINAETMEAEASISLPELSMISELAAYSNMLVCIAPYSFSTEDQQPGVTVYLYQLGEDKTASLLNTIAVSGTFEQFYLTTDGTLFLTSNQLLDTEALERNASSDAENTPERFEEVLPRVYNAQLQDTASAIPAENISVIENPVQPNYLNVTAIDLANGGATCTWSFLGREGTVTISEHMMSMITSDGAGGTQLISIDFSGNTAEYRISKSIPRE